jgi:ankyrin repeat protein
MLLCRFHYDYETFLRCLDTGLVPKRNKVDVTLQDLEGNTVLHSLCFNGHNAVTEVMQRFVRRGIQVNCINNTGYNALHCLIGQSVYECGENLVHVVRYLVKCGLDIHAKTHEGDTVLTLLCDNPNRYDFMETLRLLVSVYRLDVNSKNSNGFNALHCLSQRSCQQFQQTAVRFLIKSGANVKSTTGNGDTILHLLCRHCSDSGLFEIVRVLVIYHKLNVNQTNNQGETPLHCLCSNKSDNCQVLTNVFLFLIENGIDIAATTKNGMDTAWSYLCRNKRPPLTLLSLFIQQGIDIHSRDSQGYNCLHQLCRLNSKRRWFRANLECVRLVIDAGIDINSKIENGVDNSLHILCRLKPLHHTHLPLPAPSIHVLRLLIEKGINIRALDVNGDTALHLICRHSGNQTLDCLVGELVQAGADIYAKGSDGLTAVNILWSRRGEIGSSAPEIIDYLVNQ